MLPEEKLPNPIIISPDNNVPKENPSDTTKSGEIELLLRTMKHNCLKFFQHRGFLGNIQLPTYLQGFRDNLAYLEVTKNDYYEDFQEKTLLGCTRDFDLNVFDLQQDTLVLARIDDSFTLRRLAFLQNRIVLRGLQGQERSFDRIYNEYEELKGVVEAIILVKIVPFS